MKAVLRAIGMALYSQVHPRMLWLAVWPYLLALSVWGGLGFFFRGPLFDTMHHVLFDGALVHWIDRGFSLFGLSGVMVAVEPVVFVFLILALSFLSALLIIAVVAMRQVVAHVGQRHYLDVAQLRGGSSWIGVLNALWVTALTVIGWVLTMPFWLIVPLAVLLPLFWWAWLSSRILRYDALMAHASALEHKTLIARHSKGFFALGMVIALMNFVPLLFLFSPIFGALLFTHYGLAQLRALRRDEVIAMLAADAVPMSPMSPTSPVAPASPTLPSGTNPPGPAASASTHPEPLPDILS